MLLGTGIQILQTEFLINLAYLDIRNTQISELNTDAFGILEALWATDTHISSILTKFLGNLRDLGISGTCISDLQVVNLKSLVWLDV